MHTFRQVAVRANWWNGRRKRTLCHRIWLIIAETGEKLHLQVDFIA